MRLLQVVHALPPETYGGTELYTQWISETLARDYEVAVATPRGNGADLEGVEVFSLPNGAAETGLREKPLRAAVTDEEVDRRFRNLLSTFDPDVVHLQHFKHLSAEIPQLCAEHNVACVATLHDFWTICHREQLYRPEGRLCSGPESIKKCTDCYLTAWGRTGSGDARGDDELEQSRAKTAVAQRTRELDTALETIDLLISPSEFLRKTFIAFGTPPERIVHQRNGIPVRRFEGITKSDELNDPNGHLRVGYAGRIAPSKGVHILVEAFQSVNHAELHIHGRFDPSSDLYHARLRDLADERVRFHGWYDDSAAPYRDIDVLVVPSIWYENSPIVIQEAFASRVPVIAADAGGMAELVTHGQDGLTFSIGDESTLAEHLQRISEAPALLDHLRNGIETPTRLDDHAAALVDLYAECLGHRIIR